MDRRFICAYNLIKRIICDTLANSNQCCLATDIMRTLLSGSLGCVMQENCFLSSLPLSVSAHVLQDWLSLKSLKAFDSACCNKAIRLELQETIRSEEFVMYQKILRVDRDAADWMRNNKSASSRMVAIKETCMGKDSPTVEYVNKHSSHVRVLCIQDCRKESTELAVALVKLCTNLDALEFWPQNWELLFGILKRNRNIQELKIGRQLSTGKFSPPNSAELHLPKLCALAFNYCETFHFIENFLRTGHHITNLDLSDSTIPDDELKRIPELFPHLRALSLASVPVSDDTLDIIVRGCPRILHLNLQECINITDDGIKSVVTNLKELTSLNIHDCEGLGNQSLVHIYTYSAQTLRRLWLDSGSEDDEVGPYYEHGVLDKLFETCQGIESLTWAEACGEDNATYTLPPSIRNITSLTLAYQALCDDNLAAVATHCPHLKNLSISVYDHVAGEIFFTHEGLKKIVFGCPQLQQLHICVKPGEEDVIHPYIGLTLDLWRALRPELTIYDDNRGEIPCFEFSVLKLPA